MRLHPLSTVLARLRRAVATHGSQVAAARVLGLTQGEVSVALAGDRDPSPKVLAALGFRRVVRYVDVRDERDSEEATR